MVFKRNISCEESAANTLYEMELFERLGITGGVGELMRGIDNILTNFAIVCKRYDTLKKVRYFFPYSEMADSIQLIGEDDRWQRFLLSFRIDPEANHTNWLSNDTVINAAVTKYDPQLYEEENFINSRFRIKDGQSVGELNIVIDTVYGSDDFIFTAGNFEINLKKPFLFIPLLQHEFNHMQKSTDFDSSAYDNAYRRIVQLMKNNSVSGNVAYAIYRYCIRDERSAFVNQFYKEYDFKDLRSSEIYCQAVSDYKYYFSFLNNLIPETRQKVCDRLYELFYQIVRTIFKGQFPAVQDSKVFTDELTGFILKNIDISIKKMKKTAVEQKLDEACSWKLKDNIRYVGEAL